MGLTITTTFVTGKKAGETVTEQGNFTNPYIKRPEPIKFGYQPQPVIYQPKPVNPYTGAPKSKPVINAPKQEAYIAKNDAIKAPARFTAADAYITNNAKNDLERKNLQYRKVKELFAQASVSNIIKTDYHKPRNTDISRLTNKIIAAAEYAGVDADSIACIVKRESHFKENGLNVVTGKGPMGLTSIAIKDIFARPKLYDSQLKDLLSQYGSLSKLFAAKKSNPSLNLGNFGEILYKHGSWTALNKAIKKDYDLNLKIGSYVYKYQLNRAMANKKIGIADKEREAFKNYNGSYLKNSYANSSVVTLKAARTAASQDEKYLAALNKVNSDLNTVA